MKKLIPMMIAIAMFASSAPTFAGSTWSVISDDSSIWTFTVGSTGRLDASMSWKQPTDGPILLVLCTSDDIDSSAFGISNGGEKRGPVSISMSAIAGSSCVVGAITSGAKVSAVLTVRAAGSDPSLVRAKARRGPLEELAALELDAILQGRE